MNKILKYGGITLFGAFSFYIGYCYRTAKFAADYLNYKRSNL